MLAQVASRAELHRPGHIQRLRMHAQHQDARRFVLDQDPPQQFQSAHPRQIEVKQHQVRLFGTNLLQRLAAIGRFNDLRMAPGLQQVPQTAADNHVVVHQKYLHARTSPSASNGASHGRRTTTPIPFPSGPCVIDSVPAIALTRSRIPTSPRRVEAEARPATMPTPSSVTSTHTLPPAVYATPIVTCDGAPCRIALLTLSCTTR